MPTILQAILDKLAGYDQAKTPSGITDKNAGYDQAGSHNNNYKGPGKRGYSADHKAVEKSMKATKCSRCGSTENVQRAEVHGSNGKRHIALCRACHAKYDKAYKNLNGGK
jgi:hypothetical protein